jgi:branched-chain amino acid aminotransferase
LRLAKGAGMKVVETSVSEKDLELADELLLTNAVAGIRWVLGCGKKRYFHRTADRLTALLNETAALS